jgi:hypothetical protein
MTVRRVKSFDNSVIRLSGWELVAALALMAIVIIAALWMRYSVKEAIMVTTPMLLALRVISVPHV